MSSSRGLVSPPFVACCDNETAACCLVPATYTASKLRLGHQIRHGMSRSEEFPKLRLHFSASWSVLMINQWLLNFGWKRRTSHSIESHSCWVVSYLFLASEREQYQYRLVWLYSPAASVEMHSQVGCCTRPCRATYVHWSKIVPGLLGISMRIWKFQWHEVYHFWV